MAKEDVDLNYEIIPLNFVGSGKVMNGMFKQVNLIEACILAAPGGFLSLKVIQWPSVIAKIYGCIFLAGIPAMIAILGINDEDVISYVINFFVFWKSRRIAKFNPRAKAEINPDYIFTAQSDLPRDKLIRFFDTVTNGKFANEQDLSPDITSPTYSTYFREDADIAGKHGAPELPDELKSKSQLKREAKQRRRQAKLKAAEDRRQAKELAALQKKQAKEAKRNSRRG
jgi:hypothetical protein